MKISTIVVTLAALACLPTITACSPCDIEIVGNTAVIAAGECPIVLTDGTSGSESTSSADDTDGTTIIIDVTESGGVDATEGSVSCETNDDCGPGEFCDDTKFPFVCEPYCNDPLPIPSKGDEWGPCNLGTCNNTDVFCHDIADASVCLPACSDGMCSGYFVCAGGMCAENGECIPACEVDTDCPIAGMVCRTGVSADPVCAWPK